MRKLHSIEEIKKEHDALFERAKEEGRRLLEGNGQKGAVLKEINALLEGLKFCSARANSFDDYRWLSDTAIKWQGVLASDLNLAKTVHLSPPPRDMLPSLPPRQAMSDAEIKYWINRHAEFFGLSRVAHLHRFSTQEEEIADQNMAETYFASDVIDGNINFASRISASAFWRLENQWLKDAKLLRAYLRWRRRGKGIDKEQELRDYLDAGDHMRDMLVNRNIKARRVEFGEAKNYLENRYLTGERFDHSHSNLAKQLIDKKAARIWSMGQNNDLLNWKNAEAYATMFYENIIPAVMYDDKECVLNVLKAFQYSRARENGWLVVNCFETVLAIYFLSPDIIEDLWREAESQPLPISSVESTVTTESSFEQFKIPEELRGRFEARENVISFAGVMSVTDKRMLLEKARGADQILAIESLFQQSRLIHKETTL